MPISSNKHIRLIINGRVFRPHSTEWPFLSYMQTFMRNCLREVQCTETTKISWIRVCRHITKNSGADSYITKNTSLSSWINA